MANPLLDFVMSVVRDPDVAAHYAADPAGAIADANLSGVTTADVAHLIPVVSESLGAVSSAAGGVPTAGFDDPGVNVWTSGAATAAFLPGGPVVAVVVKADPDGASEAPSGSPLAESLLVATALGAARREAEEDQTVEVSVAAVADLVLFDGENPRSLVFQLERLRADLRALPGASGSSRPERLVDEISTRLRRLDPEELEHVDDDGHRVELDGLLKGVETGLRELSDIITRTQLSLPGGMQPLWGPDQRRVVP